MTDIGYLREAIKAQYTEQLHMFHINDTVNVAYE